MGTRATSWGRQKPPVGWQADMGAVRDLGIVVAWALNESGGLLVNDVLGTVGTVNGNADWSPPFAEGYGPSVYSGTNGYLDFGTLASQQPITGTILVWVTPGASLSLSIPLLGWQNWATNRNGVILWADLNAGNLFTRTSIGSASAATTTSGGGGVSIPKGMPSLVAVSWDGTNIIEYVVPVGSRSVSQGGVVPTAGTYPIEMGRDPSGSPNDQNPAWFHMGMVSSFVLTQEQLLKLYTEPFHWMQPMRRRAVKAGSGTSYNVTCADAPSTSDSPVRTFVGSRSLTDTPSVTSPVSRLFAGTRSLADAPIVSDSPSRTFVGARTLPDSPTVSDSVSRLAVNLRTLTDVPSAASTATRAFVGSRTLADTPSTADTVSRITSQPRAVSDSPSTVDSISRLFVGARTATDSPSTADTVTRITSQPRSASDSPSIADAVTRLFVGARTADDSPSTASAVTAIKGQVVTMADAPSASDSIARAFVGFRTVADTAFVSESIARLFVGFRLLTDAPFTSSVVIVSVPGVSSGPPRLHTMTIDFTFSLTTQAIDLTFSLRGQGVDFTFDLPEQTIDFGET